LAKYALYAERVQRWLARKGKEHPPALWIVIGVGMTLAGIGSITNRGPHAINPAPLAAIPLFLGVGIWCLVVGIAALRERRSNGL
jgi:hypothetical protein